MASNPIIAHSSGSVAQQQATISLPLCVKSALADSAYSLRGWEAEHAKRVLVREGHDAQLLLNAVTDGLRPVPQRWLAQRLEALWNSNPHSGALKASDWLKETGRLLADLPFDIIQHAIDEAVKNAKAGFMPTVGEIRAIANPLLIERQLQERRLSAILRLEEPKPAAPTDDEPCTPEAAAAIMDEFGLRSETKEGLRKHLGPPRMPTREDYIAMGVDPAHLKPRGEAA